MADGLAHPLHLVLAALVERQLDPVRARSRGRTAAGAVRPSSSSTPVGEAVDAPRPSARRRPLPRTPSSTLVARMREPVRELPVVREQQARRSCRRRGDRPERPARSLRTSPTTVGRPCGVARRRHDARRLVQEDVREGLPLDALARRPRRRPGRRRPCSARPASRSRGRARSGSARLPCGARRRPPGRGTRSAARRDTARGWSTDLSRASERGRQRRRKRTLRGCSRPSSVVGRDRAAPWAIALVGLRRATSARRSESARSRSAAPQY